ncbi:MAG TPA: peptidylprolyl isomerase [Armatimonadota bacterium]|nr:peptidylprolyl isomerase [Armatimonadota bacterium]
MAKKILVVVAALVLLSVVPAPAGTALPDVVAVVNGEKITKEQLTSTLIDWQAPVVLQQLITMRMFGQEARKAGINITEAQIKAKLEERVQELSPGQDFNEALRGRGLTPGYAFALTKMQMQAEGVLRKSFKLTDEDLDEYRRASHILIKVPYSPPEEGKENPQDKQAKEKIEKIAQEIKDGLPFAEAARKYSEDVATKGKGGDLNFFTRADMQLEFSKAAFELKPGEMSVPVKTFHGYHLIKLTAIGKETKGEDRKQLEELIFQKQFAQRSQDWHYSIMNKAKIDNALEPKKPERKPTERPKPVRQPSPRPGTTPAPTDGASEPQPDEMPPPPPPEPAAPESGTSTPAPAE